LEQVRKLADALGSATKLSARNVGEVVGGGSIEYLVRLRTAVQSERAQ
jgi:predicted NAD/FAD-binding protein